MQSTCDFLDAVKARYSLPSDYALAKKLGITHGAISNYRVKRSYMDTSVAFRVAELLEMDRDIVFAAVHGERAKAPEEKAVWESILQRLGGAAAALVLGLSLSAAPSPAQASASPASGSMYIMSNRNKRRSRHKASPFALALHQLGNFPAV